MPASLYLGSALLAVVETKLNEGAHNRVKESNRQWSSQNQLYVVVDPPSEICRTTSRRSSSRNKHANKRSGLSRFTLSSRALLTRSPAGALCTSKYETSCPMSSNGS